MFFGLDEPYAMIRAQIEETLRAQVAGTEVAAIRGLGEPLWVSLGRKLEAEPDKVQIGHFAFCFRCALDLGTPRGRERLQACVTFMFRDIDIEGGAQSRYFLDLGEDADKAFDKDILTHRFLEFRGEVS